MKKKATTNVVAFFFAFLCGGVQAMKAITFFVFEKNKKTIASITFFDGFVAKKIDGNYRSLFQ
jgi:hypothetical protein